METETNTPPEFNSFPDFMAVLDDQDLIVSFVTQSSCLVIFAIIVEMIFPIHRRLRLESLSETFDFLGKKVNKAENKHHETSLAGMLLPVLIVLLFFMLALIFEVIAGAVDVISFLALIVLLNYHDIHHQAGLLTKLLEGEDKKRARNLLSMLCLRDSQNLSVMGMCKAGCENITSKMQENFAVICWFYAAGFKGALVMKLVCVLARTYNMKLEQNRVFGLSSFRIRELMIFIPSVLYAVSVCLFNLALSVRTVMTGIVRGAKSYHSAAGGMVLGAVGIVTDIQLGGPRYYGERFVRYDGLGGNRNPEPRDLMLVLRRQRWATMAFVLCCLCAETYGFTHPPVAPEIPEAIEQAI